MAGQSIVDWSVRKQQRWCDKSEATIHGVPILPLVSVRFIKFCQIVKG
jgi:hypothetical protein